MLPLIHRQRNQNGFIKYSTIDVQLNLSSKSPPWLSIFPAVTIAKAHNASEWDSKLVSNKIRIVGFTYSLYVETLCPNNTGQYPSEVPVRVDLLRFNQESANLIYNRYTGSHLTGLYIAIATTQE